VLARARKQEFVPRASVNHRFRTLKYGLKRLAKVERELEKKRKKEARRYNKSYPGELMHFDSKRLPLIKGEEQTLPREYLFVAIDDHSRELYAGIFPDKTQYSAELFLRQVADECPYTIEYTYSDNGKEFKGTSRHAFVKACADLDIGQKFTRVKRPQTNGRTVVGKDFLWLLMLHVLPKGFRKTRCYGFLHPCSKKVIKLLQLILRFNPAGMLKKLKPKAEIICKCCGAKMKIIRTMIPANGIRQSAHST
jgi:hypothetical protein